MNQFLILHVDGLDLNFIKFIFIKNFLSQGWYIICYALEFIY